MTTYFANHDRRQRFPWSLYHRDLARRIARIVGSYGASPSILVVGCGLDPHVQGAPEGAVFYGCDLDPRAIQTCRERDPAMSARLAVCPSEYELPSEGRFGEPFDVVVAKEVIEHVPVPPTWARRAAEKVKRGGGLVLTTPNYGRFSTLGILESTLLELVARRDGYSRKEIHPSRFDARRLACLDVGPGMQFVGVEPTWTRWALVGHWTRTAPLHAA